MQKFQRNLDRILDCFVRSDHHNRWLKIGRRNELYLRKCRYGAHNSEWDAVRVRLAFASRSTLQLLNLGNLHIDLESLLDGRFATILSSLEQVAHRHEYDGVLIEGLQPTFSRWIKRAQYAEAPDQGFLKLVK